MANHPTCIRGARLFDGHGFAAAATVTIDGGRIVAVGDDAGADAVVTDLGDVTLLPGLVDAHQHLCFDGPPITAPGGHCWYLGGECEGDAPAR